MIIKSILKAYYDYRHRKGYTARIGCLEPKEVEVYINTDDSEGGIPHIHIRSFRKKLRHLFKRKINCCVMLEEARYFPHDKCRGTLNFVMRDKLNEFMHSFHKCWGVTIYELACEEWDRNNDVDGIPVKMKKDEEGNVIIPDYTNIKSYK